jgi:cold shock CspA family protein
VPEADPKKNWGEVGSKVRGICYTYNHSKNFGFMRFLSKIGPGLWITDTRRTDSPYGTAFAHESAFAPGVDINLLPSREFIFEFDLIQGEQGMQAANITRI